MRKVPDLDMQERSQDAEKTQASERRLLEGVDYYTEDSGLLVFTAHYLRKRGYCCHNGCRHCPY